MARKPTRLVIVDDSHVLCHRLEGLLNEVENVQVVGWAQDMRSGLEMVESLQPDVVTLDIKMPGENGLVLLEKIKQLERSPVVIMLTNYPYSAYRRKATDLGAEYFFDKSTELLQVIRVLRNGVGLES